MERRVEGLVNKHMAEMALQTLQQRLSAVSQEINHKTEEAPSLSTDLRPAASAEQSSGETVAERKIISLLLEIREEQQRQWAVLKELQERLQGPVCEEEAETLDVDLPLRSMEQLDETERHLEDPAAQKRMVSHLSRLGGATVDDAVRRLMHSVMSFAVGSKLNWVGRGQKRSFKNTKLQGVLFRALKLTPVGKDATYHQFADVVKKWLRFAPFRQGGSGRRQQYKPAEFLSPEVCLPASSTATPCPGSSANLG